MKPLISLVFSLFLVCGLLGFSLAQSDILNPVTSSAKAEIARTNAAADLEIRLATTRLDEQRVGAEIEAQLYRQKALTDVLFFLSAVFAGCALAVTVAVIYWLVRRVERQQSATLYLPARRSANGNRPPSGLAGPSNSRLNGAAAKHRKRVLYP